MNYIDFTSSPSAPMGTAPGFYAHITQYGGGNLFDRTPSDFAALGARIANGQPMLNGGRIVSRNAVVAFDWELSPDAGQIQKLAGFIGGFRSTNQTNPILLYGLTPVVPAGIPFNADALILPARRGLYDGLYRQLWTLLKLADYIMVDGELPRFGRYRPEEQCGLVKTLMVAREQVARYRRIFPGDDKKLCLWTRPWVGDDLMTPEELALLLECFGRIGGVDAIGIWGGGDVVKSAKVVEQAIAIAAGVDAL